MMLGTIWAVVVIGAMVAVACSIAKPTWKEIKEFCKEKWKELRSRKI
ncbi:hypothetical protein KJA17_00100 [Patescibacteria group bacterium]|nr:hypothetical protein [Patescibacteria group bacterium]